MTTDVERRLIVVTNNHSTKSHLIKSRVLDPLTVHGERFIQHATESPDFETNVADLRSKLQHGDRVVIASGDGVATQVANAVLREKLEDISIAPMAFGNFDDFSESHLRQPRDIAHVLSNMNNTRERQLMEVCVDGEHWRYSPLYTTIGWAALAARQFSQHTTREQLSRQRLNLAYSMGQVAHEYFEHRSDMLPQLDDKSVDQPITDILAINSGRIAGMIGPDHDYGMTTRFGTTELNVSKFWRNVPFGLRSLARRMPLDEASERSIVFKQPSRLPIHTEGEFALLEGVSTIQITKPTHAVAHVVTTK